MKTTIFYGPWKCAPRYMDSCTLECGAKLHKPLGCVWVADLKFEYRGVGVIKESGTRVTVTHCCCDFPLNPERKAERGKWDNLREAYRKKFGEHFGPWPKDFDEFWPGHHVFDIAHGGPFDGDVLPVPKPSHIEINEAYRQCYEATQGDWMATGTERPYVDDWKYGHAD